MGLSQFTNPLTPQPPINVLDRLKVDAQFAADIAKLQEQIRYSRWWLGVSIAFSVLLFFISILLSAIISLVT